MSFDLGNFIAAPSQELLDSAKKTDLLDIADHYGLPNVKKTMLKHEIKNILIQFFVDEEIFDSSATSQILVTQTDLQLRELEIKRQLKIEKLRLEHEERVRVEKAEREERLEKEKLEREERIRQEKAEREERIRHETIEREDRLLREKLEHEKLRLEMEEREREKERERQERIEIEKEKLEFQFKMKELELQDKIKPKTLPLDSSKTFDVTKHIRLVPPFQEKEVDKYFLHFEKVAENLKWPKEHWTLLLQSVVIGKAREIYTQLSLEQSSNYDKVKELILKNIVNLYFTKFAVICLSPSISPSNQHINGCIISTENWYALPMVFFLLLGTQNKMTRYHILKYLGPKACQSTCSYLFWSRNI